MRSKNRWIFYLIIFSICFFPQRMVMPETSDKIDGINGQRLWEYMTVDNPYQQYPAWPGKEGFYESTMPPGNILKLYLNNLALDTVINKKGRFPYSSLLIKENYTDDKKLFLITVMYKVRGFNPDRNDWFWVKYTPEGEVKLEGKVSVCIECHVGVADNDYVFTGRIK
ncbi:MAG: hypothetical protein E3K38_12670 [Candidatus Kuenenia stuttgartiensis]|nr:hypothetical protein [Candidatus Kuenenia stuttgartiensis]